jgi:hypothetical protein
MPVGPVGKPLEDLAPAPQKMGIRPNQFANTPDDILMLEIQRGSNEAIEEGYARGILSRDKPTGPAAPTKRKSFLSGIGDETGAIGDVASIKAARQAKLKDAAREVDTFILNDLDDEVRSAETARLINSTPRKPFSERIKREEGFIKIPGLGKKTPQAPYIQAFADWVNNVKSTSAEGALAGKAFRDLDKGGKQLLTDFKAGLRHGRLPDLEKFVVAKNAQLTKAGVDPKLLKSVYSKIDQFDKVSDFVHYYEGTINQLIANREFKTLARTKGWILPRGQAPHDWQPLRDPVGFPSVNVKGITQPLMAPKDLAEMINNRAAVPQKHLEAAANVASISKNLSMSGGIPRTGLNAHGVNIQARTIVGDPRSVPKVSRYLINPAKATRDYESMMHTAPWAIKRGLSLTTEGHEIGVVGSTNLVKPTNVIKKGAQRALKVWGKAFEDPLFQQIIPAVKLDKFNRTVDKLVGQGMAREEAGNLAAKVTNNLYGGINWEAAGRSKDLQNFWRMAFVAPDWGESNLRLLGNMTRSLLNPKHPAGKTYRRMIYNTVGAYVAADAVNVHNSGHHMWENPAGHALDIQWGTSGDTDRWYRPFGTAADFARLPVDIAQAALQSEDLGAGFKIIKNRLSTIARPTGNIIMNQDDFGRPITGKDDYGRTIPRGKQATNLLGEISQSITPPQVKAGMDYMSGKSNAEQAVVGAVEGPIRYSHRRRSRWSR